MYLSLSLSLYLSLSLSISLSLSLSLPIYIYIYTKNIYIYIYIYIYTPDIPRQALVAKLALSIGLALNIIGGPILEVLAFGQAPTGDFLVTYSSSSSYY